MNCSSVEKIANFGISLISASVLGDTPDKTIRRLFDAGYDFHQSLPLKNIGVIGDESGSKYFEDMWRPELEHFWQIDPSRLIDDSLQLFVLFKKGKLRQSVLDNYRICGVKYISQYFLDDPNVLFEISPQLGGPENIRTRANGRTCLVMDTRHVDEYLRMFNLEDDYFMSMFRSMMSSVLHFQPLREINNFLELTDGIDKDVDNPKYLKLREVYLFKKILKALRRNFDSGLYKDVYKPDIVVEYNPMFAYLNKEKNSNTMEAMLLRVESMVEGYFTKNR